MKHNENQPKRSKPEEIGGRTISHFEADCFIVQGCKKKHILRCSEHSGNTANREKHRQRKSVINCKEE